MATVPTGRLERELRKLYLRWVSGLPRHEQDMSAYIRKFQQDSERLIQRTGGDIARLGSYLADFPAPKELALDPVVGHIYDQMQQAAIQASIMTGLNSREAARAMLRAGLDKSYRRLERVARTETVRAYWKNQWDSTAGLGLVMVWSAESGPRTCDYCLSRDGLVVEDPNIRDHPNGRCTLLPMHPSRVAYKGTLQPDGSVTMDPEWEKPANVMVEAPIAPRVDSTPVVPGPLDRAYESFPGTDGLTDVQLEALTAYQRGDYTRINGFLRGKSTMSEKQIERTREQIAAIESAMKPIGAATLERGVGTDAIMKALGLDDLEDVAQAVGKKLQFDGFVSTSVRDAEAWVDKFASMPVQLRMIIPESAKVKGTRMAMDWVREREVLLEHGITWRVANVEQRDGQWWIDVVAEDR